jgi:hypothetical protein
MVRFDRYSPYFDKRDDFDLDLHPYDFYSFAYPFEEGDLADLAYFFNDHGLGQYMISAIERHDDIRKLVAHWRAAWFERPEGAGELVLDRIEGQWVVRDSRAGPMVLHEVEESVVVLLRRLESPVRRRQIVEPDTDHSVIERDLRWLEKHGMLFEEDEKIMSLVGSAQWFEDLEGESVAQVPSLRVVSVADGRSGATS